MNISQPLAEKIIWISGIIGGIGIGILILAISFVFLFWIFSLANKRISMWEHATIKESIQTFSEYMKIRWEMWEKGVWKENPNRAAPFHWLAKRLNQHDLEQLQRIITVEVEERKGPIKTSVNE